MVAVGSPAAATVAVAEAALGDTDGRTAVDVKLSVEDICGELAARAGVQGQTVPARVVSVATGGPRS